MSCSYFPFLSIHHMVTTATSIQPSPFMWKAYVSQFTQKVTDYFPAQPSSFQYPFLSFQNIWGKMNTRDMHWRLYQLYTCGFLSSSVCYRFQIKMFLSIQIFWHTTKHFSSSWMRCSYQTFHMLFDVCKKSWPFPQHLLLLQNLTLSGVSTGWKTFRLHNSLTWKTRSHSTSQVDPALSWHTLLSSRNSMIWW